MTAYPNTQLFIDGQWTPGASGRVIPIENPATGQKIGDLARADKPDLDRALAALAPAERADFEAGRPFGA